MGLASLRESACRDAACEKRRCQAMLPAPIRDIVAHEKQRSPWLHAPHESRLCRVPPRVEARQRMVVSLRPAG